ncbi:hypothetical protein HanRHA438_Chr10g0476371 [Helianthus annuus]|nr:hypothetical protein HanHA300_Chr10g0381001 [Helianthus annuus]KAJ0698518.1 hypothetical protein HanLR1_Chr10g0380811 [Helianthus annuus]KAJ0701863.1 hypothetical protein HanOQP8_Chr10g0383981 [Helianthus annuus]KAJ0881637.1 hypothetical protein HanRHA438_Chr10g0476371 [Helianthus annuus]
MELGLIKRLSRGSGKLRLPEMFDIGCKSYVLIESEVEVVDGGGGC